MPTVTKKVCKGGRVSYLGWAFWPRHGTQNRKTRQFDQRWQAEEWARLKEHRMKPETAQHPNCAHSEWADKPLDYAERAAMVKADIVFAGRDPTEHEWEEYMTQETGAATDQKGWNQWKKKQKRHSMTR